MKKKLKLLLSVAVSALVVMSCATCDPLDPHEQKPLVSFASRGFDLPRKNDYPLVLVGGFGVFARDEVFGNLYWGGKTDIQEILKSKGYETVTSAVGPLSSYWDRACELYAQIKGTRVDYGAAHSQRFGHAQYGRDYAGKALVPGWGGKVPKVHLMGHSMGGPTIRLLVHLLENGDPENWDGDPESLFAGGKNWVRGVVTVSAPHDGTTLAHKTYPLVGGFDGYWIQKLAVSLVSYWQPAGSGVIDFKLDQWGLSAEGKTWDEYRTELERSTIWYSTDDLCAYDCKPDSARDFNTRYPDSENVCWFSWANVATRPSAFGGKQIPIGSMNLIWTVSGFAQHVGSWTRSGNGFVTIDESWWPNDGVVSIRSMAGPSVFSDGRAHSIREWDGVSVDGVWNFLGYMVGWDHVDVIGWTDLPFVDWYEDQARLLASLKP